MAAEDRKLCDKCHERPATCHICNGRTGEVRDLCESCNEESASPEESAFQKRTEELIRSGVCKYCGAPAKMGAFGRSSFSGEEVHLWCERCCRDLAEFAGRPENAMAELTAPYPFNDEAARRRLSQQVAEYEGRLVEFMQQKVRERSR